MTIPPPARPDPAAEEITPADREPSLRQKTLSGIGWTGLTQFLRQAIQFVIFAILARLLTPADFGLVGMITVFTGFATMFAEAGFGAALVQRAELEERHRSSIFWLNLGVGLLITGLFAAAAPLIAGFYDEPRLAPLTILVSVNFTILSLKVVQFAMMRRSMAFKRLSVVYTGEVLVAGGVAITLALLGFGVWSLVAQILVSSVYVVAALWLLNDWRPRFMFDRRAVRDLLGYSSNLLGYNIFHYWTRNSDYLLIGKFVGSAGLGIYTRAYSTMLLPVKKVTSELARVMFPALSKIQREPERIRRAYLMSTRLVGLITIPMVGLLFAVAEPFVVGIFGPQWSAVTPVLQILCLVGINQTVGSTTGWIFQSQGRTDLMFRWGAISSAVTFLAFLIGVRWGITGVAIAYVVRGYVLWYPAITVPGRLIGLSYFDFVRNVAPIYAATVVMAAATYGLDWLFLRPYPHWLRLALLVPFGAAVFLGIVHVARLTAYRELRAIVDEQLSRRRGARSVQTADTE